MLPKYDVLRARQAGIILYKAFNNPRLGIFGKTLMPEDILAEGMMRGSYEHRVFITLTVSIDYQRDADILWKASRKTFEDPSTVYLFSPQSVYQVPLQKLREDMQKHKLSKKPKKDSWIWRTNVVSFLKKWDGDPLNLIKATNFDAVQLLGRIRNDRHEQGNRLVHDFPYLRGNKIAVLWIRMLRDNVKLELRNMVQVPIPVDTHIARATQMLGLSEYLQGKPSFEQIQAIWREAAEGTNLIALDFDEPLWHLSKYGCSKCTGNCCPKKDQCPVSGFCIVAEAKR
jgi:hypothetical protein